jgi:hypothetical protein
MFKEETLSIQECLTPMAMGTVRLLWKGGIQLPLGTKIEAAYLINFLGELVYTKRWQKSLERILLSLVVAEPERITIHSPK